MYQQKGNDPLQRQALRSVRAEVDRLTDRSIAFINSSRPRAAVLPLLAVLDGAWADLR
jgi:hypothetical protein